MGLLTLVGRTLLGRRKKSISSLSQYSLKFQHNIREKLVYKASKTEYGKKHSFNSINSYVKFSKKIPVVDYEDFFPQIRKALSGRENIIWPGKICWFAKSSGTTNDKSKYIPVSEESLRINHFRSGKDLLASYIINNKKTKLFDGLSLALGGSRQITPYKNNKIFTGDISAVLLRNLPIWAQKLRTPNLEVAMMPEWEEKIEKMAKITSNQNVTSLSGVPTWTIVLIKEVLKQTGKNNILEVWPNLELFIHGAGSFVPYRKLFQELIHSSEMNYLETYNASEGFFGFQNDLSSKDMLLLTNHGIFYEFEDTKTKEICDLRRVEINKNYALIISTFSGLWRYRIGDTILFTSTSPYKILISGRTQHFINAFGEEVIVKNSDQAIANACEVCNASFYNYSAGPIYITEKNRGGHEWIIEFINSPPNKQYFINSLDEELKKINSDYEAKRYKDIALKKPKVHFAKRGFFDNWLKKRNKLGGQNKVPRLSNDRKYLDEMLNMIKDFQ